MIGFKDQGELRVAMYVCDEHTCLQKFGGR